MLQPPPLAQLLSMALPLHVLLLLLRARRW